MEYTHRALVLLIAVSTITVVLGSQYSLTWGDKKSCDKILHRGTFKATEDVYTWGIPTDRSRESITGLGWNDFEIARVRVLNSNKQDKNPKPYLSFVSEDCKVVSIRFKYPQDRKVDYSVEIYGRRPRRGARKEDCEKALRKNG